MWNSDRFDSHAHWCNRWFGLTLVLLLNTGCSRLLPSKPLQDIKLNFTVENQLPGVYAIAGNTNLPERSQIAVAAIRYLYPAKQVSQDFNPNPTYAVLAYQPAEVKDGKWQTALNVWEPSPDGRFQETCQRDRAQLGLALKPADAIIFLAALAPVKGGDQLQQLENRLAKQHLQLSRRLIYGTADGHG